MIIMGNVGQAKTIIITGANSGIGKAAALKFAARGHRVILACRSEEKGREALEFIKSVTGNDLGDLLLVDLASQQSVRRFTQSFLEKYDRLDVLIHNAANFDLTMKKPVITDDGVETIFATNHLGPFLMTNMLLDTMKESAPSRIITVASKGLMMYPGLTIDFDNLNGEKRYNPQLAYYQSKQAQIMFTYEIARRLEGTGVTANCIRVTNVALPDEKLTHLPAWQQKIYKIKRKMALTPEQQAETYAFLALSTELTDNGGYWDENNRQVKSNKSSYNKELCAKLWKVSERLVGITPKE
jgi:NAD(P)-dependent dehydrogenase (short-subunit alcohol dehydrogenase family)